MRYAIYLVLLCLTWARSQNMSEEENKRIQDIFGVGAPNSSIDLTPSKDNATDCHTKDGKSGVCVLHYQCNPETGTVNTDGNSIIDIRQRECPHYLEVCCLQNQTKDTPSPPVVEQTECGWSNPGAQAFRILNDGTTAEFGEFPWMVAILRRFSNMTAWSQTGYMGGGSIIHPQVVLTAAHKVDGKVASEIKCRAGEWDTQTDKEIYPHQERDVKKIIKHADYYRPSVYNSVALLILETPYSLGNAPHMGVACLAPQAPPAATRCQSMGWGAEFDDSEKYAVVLKKVELPWVPRDKCQKELRKTRLGSRFELHPSLTCAGGEAGKDTCAGDGGSPLVCPIGNVDPKQTSSRFAIFGMVAWGLGCGDPVPAAYVNVPHLYNWIGEQMAAEGFPTSSYTYKL